MSGRTAKSPRIHGSIARAIGIEIVSGKRAPGQLLGGEIEASEALGISRTAYREAIRILAAKGLIESRPKAGTRVTPRAQWNMLDPDVLAWMFEGDPGRDFITALFELRGIVEPAACALAAARRTEDDLAAMDEALAEMGKRTLKTAEGRDADQRFHAAILAAARNEPLVSLASTVGAAIGWTTRFKQRVKARPRDPMPDHKAVLEAIRAGDADGARAAMNVLLRLAIEDMGLKLPG
ncbi:MAG: FadR family transcriptional regulator [Sphingobium sp.]|nr:FadR family transcriptional regulator [Sphingobium sp.]